MPDKRGEKFTDAQVETARRIAEAARRQKIPEEDIPTMVAIAFAESSGDSTKINPRGKDLSYGWWQINMKGDKGPERLKQFGISKNEDLLNVDTNAMAAATLLKTKQGKGHWSTFNNGEYLNWMPSAADIAPATVRQAAGAIPPRRQTTMGPAEPPPKPPVPSPRPTPTPTPVTQAPAAQPSTMEGLTQGFMNIVNKAKGLWPF